MKVTVSIIIPIFNCATTLHPVIQSILDQTYKNFEIIFVDDASTDSSTAIIENYQLSNKNIKLLSTNGEGTAFAQNLGLKSALGKYIMFFNANQVMSANLLEYLIKIKEENNATISCCDYFYITEYNLCTFSVPCPTKKEEKIKIFNSKQYMKSLSLKTSHTFESNCSLFNKLIDKSSFENFSFDTSKNFPNEFAIFDLFSKPQKIAISNQILIGHALIDEHYTNFYFSYTSLEHIEFMQKVFLYFKKQNDKNAIKNTAIKILKLLYKIRFSLLHPHLELPDLEEQKQNIDHKFGSIYKFLKSQYSENEAEYLDDIKEYKKMIEDEKFRQKHYYLFISRPTSSVKFTLAKKDDSNPTDT